MFRKYQIQSLLGGGSSGKVYLAKHLKLATHRAIKCIPKAHSQPNLIFQEARLLKDLNHPGIPIIYDIEEDEKFYYLIQEHIQGESFQAYVQNHDIISQETILSFALQLCDIFEYLHGLDLPLLYLDLKPEHIILCGNQLKLIDFGILAGQGSRGFAAPEQYEDAALDVRADIYGISALLYYMLTKEVLQPVPETKPAFPKHCSKELAKVLQKAFAYKKEARYGSIHELKYELQKLESHRKSHLSTLSPRKIIVAGSQRRIGTTHVAISLAAWLGHSGCPASYEEQNEHGVLGMLVRYKEGFREKNGVYSYGDFRAVRETGKWEERGPEKWAECKVADYGTDLESVIEEEGAQLIVLVLGGKPWEIEEAVKAYEALSGEENLVVICNMENRQMTREYARNLRRKVHCFPLDEDPFAITKEKSTLFKDLIKHDLMRGGGNNQDE